jgi:hypothetical protein
MKACAKCQMKKPISDFDRRTNNPRSTCKPMCRTCMEKETDTPQARFCRRCSETKPISAFDYRSGNRSHQVKSWCHQCTRNYFNAYMKRRYHENPQRYIKGRKDRHASNPARVMLTSAKRRARDYKMECTITLADIIVPEFCPVFGIRLAVANGRSAKNSPTIDRIDNTKGYIPGNIWVISRIANDLKRDASLADLEALVEAIKLQIKFGSNRR